MSIMADVSDENSLKKDDFIDPLGAKDPLGCAGDDVNDGVEFDITPIKSSELDAVLAENKKQISKMTIQDDDLDGETKDLFVTIDNPEKHTTTMESYITFRISTKTTRPEYETCECQVRRRYTDFLWVRDRLAVSHPTHLVPPLPEKHSLRRLDRFSPEFVKTRMVALQKFLNRIADHPVLSFNKYFQTFLTAKQSEFQAAKKESSGLLTKMADSFHNMSASYMMKNRSAEFVVMNEYINTFSEKIGVLDRISQRIVKEQYDYLAELNEWGPIFTLWSNSEDKVSLALGAIAKAVEKNFIALQELVDVTETELSHPLREYILYTQAVQTVLKRRDAIQMEYEMAHEELTKKKEEKDRCCRYSAGVRDSCTEMMKCPPEFEVSDSDQTYSLGAWFGKDPEEVKQEKSDRLERQVEELQKQVEVLNDKCVCANADLKADIERWHKNKRKDFRKLFVDMADRNVKYYEKSLKAWESAIPLIQQTDKLADSDIAAHLNSSEG